MDTKQSFLDRTEYLQEAVERQVWSKNKDLRDLGQVSSNFPEDKNHLSAS